jgi:hypothetical protein
MGRPPTMAEFKKFKRNNSKADKIAESEREKEIIDVVMRVMIPEKHEELLNELEKQL